MKNFPIDETLDNSDSGFEASIEITKEADMFAALAKAYFTMFGLTDEKIIRQFTLFANQYRGLVDWRANELESETKNFRAQADLIQAFKQTHDGMGYPIKKWTIKIKVKKWFLEKLKLFGIDFTLDNLTGKVNLKSIDPIPMIDKSDMLMGDIVLVGGTHPLSRGIRFATWSDYSHAAMFDGVDDIYEALGHGMVKNNLILGIEKSNPVAVLRPKTFNTAAAYKATQYAKSITDAHRPYDVMGALASGLSWKMAIVIVPIYSVPFKIGNEAGNALVGNEHTFFCSEAVAEAYERAGTPIVATKPQDTTPGAMYHSPNLNLIGFLVNKP